MGWVGGDRKVGFGLVGIGGDQIGVVLVDDMVETGTSSSRLTVPSVRVCGFGLWAGLVELVWALQGWELQQCGPSGKG